MTIESGEQVFFKLELGNDTSINDEDLVIKVIPLDYESDPDIYISKEEEYPTSMLDSDWDCASYGKDTCTINNKNLTKGSTFYIGVICEGHQCNF